MTEPVDPPNRLARHPLARAWWIGVGFVSVGIGFVGVVVPGLPTTVFFVFAAWCFSRSSPRFEHWLLNLPRVGPLVRDYRAGLGMPRRVKVVALAMMWTAVALSSWVFRGRPVLFAALIAAGLVGTWVVGWRVPTRERVEARTEGGPSEI
jgi:uncharacterized protein